MVSLALPPTAFPHWLRAGHFGRLPSLVNVLLIIWLAWLAAGLSWMLVPESADESLAPVTPTTAPTAPQVRFDERRIASWHLFGVPVAEKPVAKTTPVNAPETRLKLTLRGVFASKEAGHARAIVGDPRGQEQSYAVGDPLPGGAKLSEIYPDRIILERGGQFETLKLPKEVFDAGSSTSTRATSAPSPAVGGSNRATAFNRYRNEIKQNPASILNYVRATPAREAGAFIGFNIQPGPKPDALEELGLQAGDIVTSINGMIIDSPATGMQAMQTLGDGDSASVTLLRDGQEMSLNLTLPGSGQ